MNRRAFRLCADPESLESEKVAALVSQHQAWAKRVGVVPREQIAKSISASNSK
jgi:hypothetical protein